MTFTHPANRGPSTYHVAHGPSAPTTDAGPKHTDRPARPTHPALNVRVHGHHPAPATTPANTPRASNRAFSTRHARSTRVTLLYRDRRSTLRCLRPASLQPVSGGLTAISCAPDWVGSRPANIEMSWYSNGWGRHGS